MSATRVCLIRIHNATANGTSVDNAGTTLVAAASSS
jgi:translation initiation factor 2B subunit (eIF-2B alpha/beta/delta family)